MSASAALTDPVQLDRAVFSISGPDSENFLQTLLTQNMARLQRERAVYTALLTPQGKVAFDFLLWRAGEVFLVDAPSARAAHLARALQGYRLRAKVEIGPIDPAAGVWAAPDAQGLSGVFCPDPRLGALGARLLAPAPCPCVDEPSPYQALRLALGVPDIVRSGAENDAFALEALLEELNGVDFHKGCFVGQENVSRMKRRATTRRKFCPVTFEGAAPTSGTVVMAGDAEIGEIREGMDERALAFVRLDRALEAPRSLKAGDKEIALDVPAWLIKPQ